MSDLLIDDLSGESSGHMILPDHLVEPLWSVLAIESLVTSHCGRE